MVLSGLLFSGALILCTWCTAAIFLWLMAAIHPLLGIGCEILLIYFCISSGELSRDAMEVGKLLENNELETARERLSLIVGRDVTNLDEEGIARGAVETIAENLVDGFISPLFFAAIGGAPLAMAFKMISTLDSMVGYKNETYEAFGKASARTDDLANFIPARFAVLVISAAAYFLSGKGAQAFKCAVKEGKNHSSPNAGYPEAVFAGALEIKLGGPNFYNGQLVSKPYIGEKYGAVETKHIKKACDLMWLSSLLWVMVVCLVVALINVYI